MRAGLSKSEVRAEDITHMVAVAAGMGREFRTLGLIGTGHFLSHLYQLALPPLFPLIMIDLDANLAGLGMAIGAYSVSTGILQTPVGFMVDRIGGRRVLIAGLLVNAIGIVAAGFSTSLWMLGGFLMLAGAGNSVFHPADYALLSASIDKSRIGRAFSLHSLSGTAGFAVAPLIMLGLATVWDWRIALFIVGAAGIAAAVMMMIQRKTILDVVPRATTEPNRNRKTTGWRALMTRPMIMFFLFYAFLAGAGSGLNTFTVTAMIAIYDIELSSATATLTSFLVMSGVGVLLGGFVADRVKRHDFVLMAAYGVAAACLMLVASRFLPFWLVIGTFAMAGFMRGLVNPARDILVRRAAPPGAVGSAFGFITTGFTVGQAFAPPVYGWLMDIGSPTTLFWLASAFTLIAIPLVFASRERALYGEET
jgi:MFS family permease